MQPFFIHKPASLKEFFGQDKPVKQINDFLNNFSKGKALFLYGPPGVGKTSSIYAFAKENNYDLLELNASDTRNQKGLQEFLSKATGQASLFGTKKIILLDEIDGLSGMKDRGASTAIANFIKTSIFPIVLTGVNVFDKKFSSIKKLSSLVEFKELSIDDLVKIMNGACSRAKITCDDSTLRLIARNAAGDARAALNDLFTFMIVKHSEVEDLGLRKKTETLGNALVRVLKSTDPKVVFGAYDDVDEDLDKIFLWVDQNMPVEYKNTKDLANAYGVLSLADKFFGRIRRWQYYRYYVYCYLLLSVGIAISKDKKYSSTPSYKQPVRLLLYWQANMKYAKRKSIISKLAEHMHGSTKRAQDSFYLLAPALIHNKELQELLEITPDELTWLKQIQ